MLSKGMYINPHSACCQLDMWSFEKKKFKFHKTPIFLGGLSSAKKGTLTFKNRFFMVMSRITFDYINFLWKLSSPLCERRDWNLCWRVHQVENKGSNFFFLRPIIHIKVFSHFIFFVTYKWAQQTRVLLYSRPERLARDKHSRLSAFFSLMRSR